LVVIGFLQNRSLNLGEDKAKVNDEDEGSRSDHAGGDPFGRLTE
jgi:hypothetical protein